MEIKPHFVAAQGNPEKLVSWHRVDCEIKARDGRLVFAMKNVEAPSSWSQLAVDVAANKYFRKTGVGRKGAENSIRQMVERVVFAIVQSGKKQKYFSSPKAAKIFANELKYILLTQRAFFNSPVWFNCGLWEKYKIKGDTPNWAWDFKKKKIMKQSFAYVRPQVSACFIQNIEDSLESIFDLAKNEALLFKFGSGSGTNFSKLRSKYEKLEGGGTSSGLISFLEVLDRGAASVKSGGTTRRAAKMVILDDDHPELMDFIKWKAHEEQKARALIEAGYNGDFEGEAFHTISGQNANNSIRISNDFMKSLSQKLPWKLKSRVDGKMIQEISSTEIWTQISQSAWACADPGLQFHQTINDWHTSPADGEIRASNPCSEYLFLDDSACNLASLNLPAFLESDGRFDLESYLHTAKVMFLAQDILVDLAGYPTEKIAKNSQAYRPLGLGFCGLGSFLMKKAISYDSDLGRNWASVLASLLTARAYLTSAEIAQNLGAFSGFRKNKKSVLRVLEKHQKASKNLKLNLETQKLNDLALELWSETLHLTKKKGIRNSQASVMAPTGTIGLVMDCDTTGIEPEFSLVRFKKLSGGGDLKLISASVSSALENLKYNSEQIREILDYIEVHWSIEGAPHLKEIDLPIFDTAMKNGNMGKRFLSAEGHLKMMAAIQCFISGAISKTVNLPVETTPEEIGNIYLKAWQMGLKSIAIYRDSSKAAQPLKTKQDEIKTRWQGDPLAAPVCPDCGTHTELAGGCFRCGNCGTTLGCA